MSSVNDQIINSTEILKNRPIQDLQALILPVTDLHSPYHLEVPTTAKAVQTLTKRFHGWIRILKSLIEYFLIVAVSSQQFLRIHLGICESVDFPFFTNGTSKGFNYQQMIKTPVEMAEVLKQQAPAEFPVVNEPTEKEDKDVQQNFMEFGSRLIQDVPNILINYHKNLSFKNLKLANELRNLIIPRLEELRRDLGQKIKEIRMLQDDFKNDLRADIALTGQRLYEYLEVLSNIGKGTATAESKRFKKDPFMLKFKLDFQLKAQVLQENAIREAYINLQTTASELEKIVTKEVQTALTSYVATIDAKVKLTYELMINDLRRDGYISKPNFQEWNLFVDRDNNVNLLKNIKAGQLIPKSRKLSDIDYPFRDNFLSKCIKTGYLSKKSKYLKNYNHSFYLLTVSSLYEFNNLAAVKSEAAETLLLKNSLPTGSYNLDCCALGVFDYDKSKFIMHYSQKRRAANPPASKEFLPEIEVLNISFRHDNPKELLMWYNYLKQLLKFSNPYDRANYIEKRYLKSVNKKRLSEGKLELLSLSDPSISAFHRNEKMTSDLQGIGPEIIISDMSFPSSAASIVLNDGSCSPRSPPLNQQYHVYSNALNNKSHELLTKSKPLMKRPNLLRMANSTSNIHEGSLSSKLDEIKLGKKPGKKNKFDSFFSKEAEELRVSSSSSNLRGLVKGFKGHKRGISMAELKTDS